MELQKTRGSKLQLHIIYKSAKLSWVCVIDWKVFVLFKLVLSLILLSETCQFQKTGLWIQKFVHEKTKVKCKRFELKELKIDMCKAIVKNFEQNLL